VFSHSKIAVSAFMVLFAACAAMANAFETSPAGTKSAPKWSDYPDHIQTRGGPVASNSACPWLEGYPDCHPDAVPQPDIEPARQHPSTDPSRHQRTPKYRATKRSPGQPIL
jgi:hypothetical protein